MIEQVSQSPEATHPDILAIYPDIAENSAELYQKIANNTISDKELRQAIQLQELHPTRAPQDSRTWRVATTLLNLRTSGKVKSPDAVGPAEESSEENN